MKLRIDECVCDEREESSQTNQQLIISQKFNPDKKFNKLMIGSLQDSHLISAWISVCQLERVCQAVLVKYFLVETLKIISDRDWGSRRWLCYQFELWLAEKNQGLSFIMAGVCEDASSEMCCIHRTVLASHAFLNFVIMQVTHTQMKYQH